MALPFGLRSAPYIFTAIADLVEWMLTHNHGVDFFCQYLDFFSDHGSASFSGLFQQLAGVYPAVLQDKPLPSPGQAGGAPLPTCPSLILSSTLPHYTGPASGRSEEKERIIALLGR